MTKVGMMQPAFLPWQGLFELILKSDKFIFSNDYQYCPKSHHTRNKLFVSKNQVDFYIIPVQKPGRVEAGLNEILIVEDSKWKEKLLRTFEFNYQKAPYYSEIIGGLQEIINSDLKTLAEMNIAIIKYLCKILNIETTFLYSSDFSKETSSNSVRTQRVVELFEWAGADEYLCAFGSFDYMKEDGYDYKKYPVIFQNYIPKLYTQIHSKEFVPYLSVLDALFNIGGEQTLELIKSGTEHWLTWDERDKFSN